MSNLPISTSASQPPSGPGGLPWPPDLPDGLPARLRVLQLTDADAVSHGLVDGTPLGRATDDAMRCCLDLVASTARAIDPHAQLRYAASSQTATHHLGVLTADPNNVWAIRRGLDGADGALLEELTQLIQFRRLASQPGHRRPAPHASLVILVAQDRAYAPAVRQLRLLGVPTWLLVPGRYVSAALYTAACSVSFIGPHRPWSASASRPKEYT